VLNEKAKIQQEKAKSHAQATQQIYDDIFATLKEKFMLESKLKVQDISKQMKSSMEAKLKELTHSQECAVNKLNQKVTSLNLQLTLKDTDIESLKSTIKKLEEDKEQ
jgi:hypothetical protein